MKNKQNMKLSSCPRDSGEKTSQAPPSHSPCSCFPESASCCTRCFRSHSHSFRRKPWSILTSLAMKYPKMGVSKNNGTPKSFILIGFSIIKHPFWGYPYFWKHPNQVFARKMHCCIWLHLRFSLRHPICLMCNLCWSIVASRISWKLHVTPHKDTMK